MKIPSDILMNGEDNYLHPTIIEMRSKFTWPVKVDDVVIELSTPKHVLWNDIPLTTYYTSQKLRDKYELVDELSDDTIIARIKDRVCELYGANCSLHVISHVNLKDRALNALIPGRDAYVQQLRVQCATAEVHLIEPSEHLAASYLDEVMIDATHYSPGVKRILHRCILREIKNDRDN